VIIEIQNEVAVHSGTALYHRNKNKIHLWCMQQSWTQN